MRKRVLTLIFIMAFNAGCNSSLEQETVMQEAVTVCPDLSGKYLVMGKALVQQTGCSSLAVTLLEPAPEAMTTQKTFTIGGPWIPRRRNSTWVERLYWENGALFFVSRYSDEYLATGVGIGENVDTRKVYEFRPLENGNIVHRYSIYGVNGQEVDRAEWRTFEIQKID